MPSGVHPSPGLAGSPSGAHASPGLASNGSGGVVGSPATPSGVHASPGLASVGSPAATANPPIVQDVAQSSPFKPEVKWLKIWPATVTAITGSVVTVTLAGDTTEVQIPLETSTPTVGASVRVSFADAGRCAVTAILGGFA